MHSRHLGDDAELYVVGALDECERASVEAHVAQCEECRRLLGAAEETLLALEREAAEVAMPFSPLAGAPKRVTRAAPWWIAALAAAAAFVIGVLLPRGASVPPSRAAHLAMLHSHFSHAQFRGAPLAKVIYPRERNWYYVIVEGSVRYEVDGIAAGRVIDLGTTAPAGLTSELFARSAERFDRVQLRADGRIVEFATIR